MTNSLKSQKKEGLESKPKQSQKTLEVEEPSLMSEKMTEEQMGRFLQELMNLQK